MIKYFNEALVLTSESPEGFINFVYDPVDTNIWYLIPRVDTNLSPAEIFVNGLDLNGGIDPSNLIYDSSLGYALLVDFSGDPSIASFIISSDLLSDFNYNLKIDIYDTSTINTSTVPFETIDISIYNRQNITEISEINTFETTSILTEGDTSYLLMRTNPKLTGNIKLVADSNNKIYLDTFKVSDILSNKKYRKQQVSGNSVLSSDIRRVFEDLPLGELYRLDNENTLDIGLPTTNLYDQYDLNYSYGSRLFLDELYKEDYAMFAPIWINREIPSYFSIFRLDGVYNQETYDELDLEDLAEKYIIESKLHKSWSLKETAPLGIYFRNHVKELLQFRAPVFLSLTDPASIDFDPNTWYGNAVDKGINVGRSEVPYFFNQNAGNYTDMNAFISEGFERNNLVLPNLINMEYIFDDEDVSMYSMHRYFGLYLTENELYKISYYADSSDGNISIISLDGRDSNLFFNSLVFDSSGNISDNYKNRIFGLDDVLSFNRITQSSQADGSDYEFIKEWVNKPGVNLFNAGVEQKNINDFITFRIHNLLEPGEILRIIDKNSFIIWEVYGTNNDILNAGESLTYASSFESTGYPIVNRVAFSTKGNINNQISAIKKAFDVFSDYENTPFRTGILKSNFLSILILDEYINNKYDFQRITSNITDGPCNSGSPFRGIATSEDISFQGRLIPDVSDFEIINCDSSYGPINFEIFGNRQSITLNLFDSSTYYFYSLDESFGNQFTDNVLYLSEDDSWYRAIQKMDVSINGNHIHEYLYFDDPNELEENIIIITEHPIKLLEGNGWNAYDVYPLSISLMGINPVKDMDYTVYDATLGYESQYWYDRSDDHSTYQYDISAGKILDINDRNSFVVISGAGQITIGSDQILYSAGLKFNTFFGEASINAVTDTIITYNILDGSTSFASLIPGSSEENINDYYLDSSIKDTLKYGLTIPTVVKWSSLGTDCRGNPLRLILNGNIFESSTNFIPFDGAYENEISFPMFKYLDPGDRAWESYTYFDINDSINYTLNGSAKTDTIKQFMFDFPNVDIFSKLMYSNSDQVNGTYVRSSIVYYNQYKDTVEGIINGLNLSLQLAPNAKNILNIKDWDRYRFSFMSTPSRNTTSNSPMEAIINENTETILIIWYQGNDILNYSYRNSSKLPGKGLLSDNTFNKKWEGFIDMDSNYSHVKSPFYINSNDTVPIITNIYGLSTSGYSVLESSPFFQLNINLSSNINSIFNAYGNNFVSAGNTFVFSKQYNTFNQYVNYIYFASSSTIGSTIINKGYQYITNDNPYISQTTDLDSFNFILNNNNIDYHIIRADQKFSNEDFPFKPLAISRIDPKSYTPIDSSKGIYTYLGWYQPQFNNLFNFNANENSELIDIVDKDFTLGNTYFNGYENIPQYWYNKVVNKVSQTDISIANSINYLEERNIFQSQWDAKYYTLTLDGNDTKIDGFNSSLELPSFFGSKLIKLPDVFELVDWDITSASSEVGKNWNTLSFDLTRNIINSFKNNTNFISNWEGLTISDNAIDGYIKKTIVNYYNITRPKIIVNIYSKPYDGQGLYFTRDSSFTKDERKNIEGTLDFVNGNYIYNMKLDLLPKLSYYISFELIEK